MIAVIAALTPSGVIGHQGKLPWHLPEELALFKQLTLGSTVIMGRKTFASLPHPLEGRTVFVVSSTPQQGVPTYSSLTEALHHASTKEVFIAGGVQLYKEGLGVADQLYLSCLHEEYTGDVSFPPIDFSTWTLVDEKPYKSFTLKVYHRG